jgi:hypothetical protein
VLVKALARAWRWQKLLDRGVYASVTEIAEAEKGRMELGRRGSGISQSQVSFLVGHLLRGAWPWTDAGARYSAKGLVSP